MKVAYLISQYPAPSHVFIRREIAALRRLGLNIETYSIRPGESLSDVDKSEESRTFCVLSSGLRSILASQVSTFVRHPKRFCDTLRFTMTHRLPGLRPLAMSFVYFAEAIRLAVELERDGATHVHNHFSNAAANVGLAASRFLGIGWSVTVHGLSDFDGPTTPLLPEKLEAARFAVSVTHYGRAQAMRMTDPAVWSKLHVVRCGIDTERMPRPARSPAESGRPLEVLSVGRLAPEKGHLGLIEAFAQAIERGENLRLVLIGGGPLEGQVRAEVARRGIASHVEFRGSQPERVVLEAMAKADLFVLASFMEGLPVVLMEALALELPVIAPTIAGIPELVVHGETGLLFAAGHWEELSLRISELAADAALRERLGRKGRERVLEEFDVARAVEPLADLLGHARNGVH